jgi:hypothetical protein
VLGENFCQYEYDFAMDRRRLALNRDSTHHGLALGHLSVMAFYEKVIKVKADVAAYLINCFPSA